MDKLESVVASLRESLRRFENIALSLRNECAPDYQISIAEHACSEILASIDRNEVWLVASRERYDELVELEYRMAESA